MAKYTNRKIITKPDGKLKILFSGRLIEKKGVVFLIEVMNMLKDKVDFELNLCGGVPCRYGFKTY